MLNWLKDTVRRKVRGKKIKIGSKVWVSGLWMDVRRG